jgi:hypothetical protein
MKSVIFTICILLLNSCYFFREDSVDSGAEKVTPSGVIGGPIASAGGADSADLAQIYSIRGAGRQASSVRPDPDTYIVNLLSQFREQDFTFARVIGRLDAYRSLLGGANEDFTTIPTKTFDATSLLAHMNVAEEVCYAMVYPNEWYHGEWETLLPQPAANASENITYMLKSFVGLRDSDIEAEDISLLSEIFSLAQASDDLSLEHYVPVCTAILLDINFLLL